MGATMVGKSRGQNLSTASVTRYLALVLNKNNSNGTATEAEVQVPFGAAGVLSRLAVYVSANARVTATTFKSRKNGADGNCIVSVGAGLTGWFEDTTNSDTIAVGDLVALASVTSTGAQTLTHNTLTAKFVASSGSAVVTGNNIGGLLSAGSTRYCSWGQGGEFSGTENDGQRITAKVAGVLSRCFMYVTSNTSTTGATAVSRINGVTGNIIISIPASTNGLFQDTTHSDSYAAGDKVGAFLSGTAGSGSMLAEFVGGTYSWSNDVPEFIGVSTGTGGFMNSSGVGYYSLFGYHAHDTTESLMQTKMQFGFTLKNFHIVIGGSGSTTNSFDVKTRVNGVDGASIVTVPAGTVGYFEDTTHTETILQGDLLCLAATSTGGGNSRQLMQYAFLMDQGAGGGGGSGGYPGPGLVIGN